MPQPAAAVGVVEPTGSADLPSVVLALSDVELPLAAVGRTPSAVRTGALRVQTSLDLAEPILHAGDEAIVLLSADRRSLQLPHGGIVHADGTTDGPILAADLSVRLGTTTMTIVAASPTANHIAVNAERGVVTFGSALPATGRLELGYFIGTWEERVERYRGVLSATVAAATAADTARLGDEVVAALAAPLPVASGLRTIDPVAIGPVASVGGPGSTGRRRPLTFKFEAELIFPLIRTSGGEISEIDAAVDMDGSMPPSTERFIVRKR